MLVRCLHLLFSRVIDIGNFSSYLNSLSLSHREEIYHRIGILNIWSPIFPDCDYKLYLSSWDHREAAKILFRLAVVEPGDNLLEQFYQPSPIEDHLPGWELPLSWTTEISGSELWLRNENDGEEGGEGKLPKHGIITFVYTSDPKSGCIADMNERELLTKTRSDWS